MIFNTFVIQVLERQAKPSRDFAHFIKMLEEKMSKDEALDPMSYNPTFIKNEMEKHYEQLFPFIKKLKGTEREIASIMYHRNIVESFSKTSHSIAGFKIPSDEDIVSLLSRYTKLPQLEVEIILQLKDRPLETSHVIFDNNYNEYGDPNPEYDEEPVSDYEYFSNRYDPEDDY